MHWCPRQTARIGVTPANRWTSSIGIPASFGVHGPGDIAIASGARAAIASTVIASLRSTATSAPSSPKYCARL
jgi:hypothetical protein